MAVLNPISDYPMVAETPRPRKMEVVTVHNWERGVPFAVETRDAGLLGVNQHVDSRGNRVLLHYGPSYSAATMTIWYVLLSAEDEVPDGAYPAGAGMGVFDFRVSQERDDDASPYLWLFQMPPSTAELMVKTRDLERKLAEVEAQQDSEQRAIERRLMRHVTTILNAGAGQPRTQAVNDLIAYAHDIAAGVE